MYKKTLILASALGLIVSAQAFAQETDADNRTLLGIDTNQASTNGTAMDDGNVLADDASTIDMSSPSSAAVASGTLSGTVSDANVNTGLLGMVTASNRIDNGSVTGVSGITTVAQQSGANGMTQQNVVVQSNMDL